MMIAAAHAIKDLAREPVPKEVIELCHNTTTLEFGPNYIIPKPQDPRLIKVVPPAVAKAAIDTKVAKLGYPKHYPPVEHK